MLFLRNVWPYIYKGQTFVEEAKHKIIDMLWKVLRLFRYTRTFQVQHQLVYVIRFLHRG